jgi:hypothetical protein
VSRQIRSICTIDDLALVLATGMKLCSRLERLLTRMQGGTAPGHAVPPLTRMFWTVTQRAASLARNAATAAI